MAKPTFDFDFDDDAKLNAHIKSFFLDPDFWIDPSKQLAPLSWKRIRFNEINKGKIPKSKGVYAFVLVPKFDNFLETRYLFYIGKTNRTLSKRFDEYIKEKKGVGKPRKKVYKMLNQYDGYLYFYYTEISSKINVDTTEESLLNVFVPHINTSIPEARIHNELKNIYERN
jgi:hypothetical protein